MLSFEAVADAIALGDWGDTQRDQKLLSLEPSRFLYTLFDES
jgi:hypothetical protein